MNLKVDMRGEERRGERKLPVLTVDLESSTVKP